MASISQPCICHAFAHSALLVNLELTQVAAKASYLGEWLSVFLTDERHDCVKVHLHTLEIVQHRQSQISTQPYCKLNSPCCVSTATSHVHTLRHSMLGGIHTKPTAQDWAAL